MEIPDNDLDDRSGGLGGDSKRGPTSGKDIDQQLIDVAETVQSDRARRFGRFGRLREDSEVSENTLFADVGRIMRDTGSTVSAEKQRRGMARFSENIK